MVLGYSFLLSPDLSQQIKELLKRLQRVIEQNDESAAKKSYGDLDKATDNLPGQIYALLALMRGLHEARSKQMESAADQISKALKTIERAMRNHDDHRALQLLAEIKPVLEIVRHDVGGDTGTNSRDALSIASRPGSWSDIRLRMVAVQERPKGTPEVPTSRIEKVHFAVSAPPSVQPGRTFFVDVWAHVDKERAEVERQIRLAVAETEPAPLIRSQGPFPIRRGTTLHVRLQFADLLIENPEGVILWQGGKGNATFTVATPEKVSPGQRIGLITINWGGCLQVARVPIQILVAPYPPISASPIVHHMQRIQRAFASYAREDSSAVLARIQGMQKILPELDVFFDVVSLRSGDDWETRLWQEIPSRDVFYLFWSRNASKSSWVEKEWRCALETRGLAFIDPVPLESPDVAKPPEELRKKHFNDWHLAYQTAVS